MRHMENEGHEESRKMQVTLPSQTNFAQAGYKRKKKRTRREIFLEKMERVVPWSRLRA